MLRRFWPHQETMYRYTHSVAHPALFVQMRLGKTLVVIRRCKTYTPRNTFRRILIVAPNSALPNWEMEFEAEKQKHVYLLLGEREVRKDALRQALSVQAHSWCLINREGHRALPAVGKIPWDAVVLDESTCIKAPPNKCKITKFFHKNFRDVPHRWLLTGHPAPESELDYYSQMRFLHDRPFGCNNYWRFRERFFSSDPQGHDFWLSPKHRPKVEQYLAKNSFVLRRKDVGMEKEKIYEQRWFKLPRALVKATRHLEDYFTLEYRGAEITDFKYSGAVFQKLRELANGYFGEKIVWTAKIQGIVELALGELRNDPIIVWVNFNRMLEPLADLLAVSNIDSRIVTGEKKYATRAKYFRDFNQGKYQMLLMQAQCGEYGADLSGGSVGIYLDGLTSGVARTQTEDRIVHMDKEGPLLIIDMLTQDTVDEDIFKLIHRKKRRSVRLLDVVKEIQTRRERRELQAFRY